MLLHNSCDLVKVTKAQAKNLYKTVAVYIVPTGHYASSTQAILVDNDVKFDKMCTWVGQEYKKKLGNSRLDFYAYLPDQAKEGA